METLNVSEQLEVISKIEMVELPLNAIVSDEHQLNVDSHKAIVRADSGQVVGIVGQKYELTQPQTFIDRMILPFLENDMFKLTKAYITEDSSKLIVQTQVQDAESEVLPGDLVKARMNFYTSFDGSLSNGSSLDFWRQICSNGLMGWKAEASFKTRHTLNSAIRMEQAKRLLMQAQIDFSNTLEVYKSLATRKINSKEHEIYVDKVFNVDRSKDVSTRTENKVRQVIDLANFGRDRELVPVKNTAWNIYNGVTEYLTHDYGRSEESREQGLMFGESQKINTRALTLAAQLVH